MPQIKLETHGCIECDKPVKVPMVTPYDGPEEVTGMTVEYIDEDQNTHLIGVLCYDCASKLCDEGIVGIAMGGGGPPEAWVHKLHDFPFKEKNGIQCQCGICMEKDDDDWPW